MTRRSAAILLVFFVAATGCHPGKPPVRERAAAGDLAIVGATVVPMDRPGTLVGRTVLVRGDRIVAVAPAANIDITGATIVDGRGKWLLPGLADMHVHLQGEEDFGLFLLEGVTTVRDLFGSPQHLAWRDAIAHGEREGPTLVAAGPIIDGDPPFWPGSAVATTPEEARAAVQAQAKAGYDWIKVYSGLPAEAYFAAIAEAKAQGLPVAGHVPRSISIEQAIASGQRSIEHLDGYVPFVGEPHVTDAIVAATAAAELWNCPTLVVMDHFGRLDHPESLAGTRGLDLVQPLLRASWDPKNDFRLQRFSPEMFETIRQRNVTRRELIGKLSRAGAKLVLGTDTGNPFVVAGFAVHEELALLVGAGLTPWQALRMATAAAAELVGAPGTFGVVAAGAQADLILVDRDPTADVGAVADPAIVIVRGKLHRHDELLAAARAALVQPTPADRFAKLPALEAEGEKVVAASYEVLFHDQVIGGERAVLSRAGQGADAVRVVRGQAVYEMPRLQYEYRATAESLEMTGDGLPGGLKVTRAGGKVTAVLGGGAGGGPPVEAAAAADAVVAPQTIAEFFWYAERLADLKVGAARELTAVEVRTERGVVLEPGRFTFTRRADVEGRRVYEVAGKNGDLELTGAMTVDADGAPHEVTATVKFGTFVTRRTE